VQHLVEAEQLEHNNVGHADWSAFAAANPAYRGTRDLAFVIAGDGPFNGLITDLSFTK
jgi:hypothetical protein